jgi:hypothetical protein
MTDQESPVPDDLDQQIHAPPVLQLELGRSTSLMEPGDAGILRDALLSMDSPAASRLAAQIDVVVTTLLAAPLHAGTRSVRVASDERGVLYEAAMILEQQPSDGFAKLRSDLSAGGVPEGSRPGNLNAS